MRNVFRNGNAGSNTPMTPFKFACRSYCLANDFFHKIINKGAEKIEAKTGMTKPLIIVTMTAGACLVEGPLAASVGRDAHGVFTRVAMIFSLNIFTAMKYFPKIFAFGKSEVNLIEFLAKYSRFPMLLTTIYGSAKYVAGTINNIDGIVLGIVSTISLYLLSTSHGILDKLLAEASSMAAVKKLVSAESGKG